MADYKTPYSDAANHYVSVTAQQSEIDGARYARSKERERLFNENWLKRPVNINEVVERFAPGSRGRVVSGYKLYYEGPRYQVRTDMVAGYLRVYDKKLKSFVLLDGTPSTDRTLTHFKILKRSEM